MGPVYGGPHGIEGVLKEELLDLSAQPAEEVAAAAVHAGGRLDRHLPLQAQKLGPGRRTSTALIEVFKAHDVGYFLYIGGNDSMDTANKIAAAGRTSEGWTWSASACRRRSTTTSATASSS